MTSVAGTIRFAVARVSDELGEDLEVQVFVDDIEMTSRGAGRIGADHTWERPEDTAERLILTGVDHAWLAAEGLRLQFARPVFDDPSTYRVVLRTTDPGYQVFLRFPLRGRSPVEVVDEALKTLRTPPASWPATFSPMSTAAVVAGPPAIAGRRWRQEHFLRRRGRKG
jgi:hypothetical protein